MSSVLEIADTPIKRDLLQKAVNMYLSNLKCQLKRTRIGFEDKKVVIANDGTNAVERLTEKVRQCNEMAEMLRDELFVD
jgi:CheY-like chemotaxis protein